MITISYNDNAIDCLSVSGHDLKLLRMYIVCLRALIKDEEIWNKFIDDLELDSPGIYKMIQRIID